MAHSVADDTEAAYFRSDLFEKRRRLMECWADFCAAPPAEHGKVVSFRGA